MLNIKSPGLYLILTGVALLATYSFLSEEVFMKLYFKYTEDDASYIESYLIYIVSTSFIVVGMITLFLEYKYGVEYLSNTNMKGEKVEIYDNHLSFARVLKLILISITVLTVTFFFLYFMIYALL